MAGGAGLQDNPYCILHEDNLSFAFGLSVRKLGVLAVSVQDCPEKLSSVYMITVHPLGTCKEEAQSFGTPLAASCDKV